NLPALHIVCQRLYLRLQDQRRHYSEYLLEGQEYIRPSASATPMASWLVSFCRHRNAEGAQVLTFEERLLVTCPWCHYVERCRFSKIPDSGTLFYLSPDFIQFQFKFEKWKNLLQFPTCFHIERSVLCV
ncbi:hypothetical protein CEXT_57661, partial [Caerostris extrusa]